MSFICLFNDTVIIRDCIVPRGKEISERGMKKDVVGSDHALTRNTSQMFEWKN
jgi:hypothetical protein